MLDSPDIVEVWAAYIGPSRDSCRRELEVLNQKLVTTLALVVGRVVSAHETGRCIKRPECLGKATRSARQNRKV
jgi:hypothetical protein